MSHKFYQFDYAEMEAGVIKNLGILVFESAIKVTHDVLIAFVRKKLDNPSANIFISNITKLNKADFIRLTV
jgi:hypothetical protein